MLRFTDNLIIQMTRNCNLHCKYCYENYAKTSLTPSTWTRKYIDHNTFKQVLDTALYYRCILGKIENYLDIHLHGGEVTLIPWDELKQDIEYILLRKTVFPNLTWCIQSNGTNITEEMARFFVQQNTTFGLSFDGFEPTGRMDRATTEVFLDRLKYFNDNFGLRYAVISVLTTDNIKTWFKDMRSLTYMFDTVGANLLDPPPGQESLVPTDEEIWEFYYKPVLDTFMTDDPLKERELQIVLQEFIEKVVFGCPGKKKTGCFNKLCGHGANMTALDPNLQLYACDKFLEDGPYAEQIMHTGLTTPDFLGLQQIRTTIDFYQQMFQSFDALGCNQCPAEFMCPGTCQAFQISKQGTPGLTDQHCELIQQIYRYLEQNWHIMLQHLILTVNLPFDQLEITPLARQRLQENHLKLIYDPVNSQVQAVLDNSKEKMLLNKEVLE